MGKDLKGKELGKGLNQRKDGRYQARFTTLNGKRVEKNFDKIKEARNWLDEEKHKLNLLNSNNITVDEWFNYWIRNYKEGIVADNTKKNYSNRYEYNIKKTIGDMELTDVKQIHCQQVLKKMIEDGKYAYGTIELTAITLHALFKSAFENGYIVRNPADSLKIKKRDINDDENDKRVLTRNEQKEFIQYAKKSIYYNAFSLVLETGLRAGEIGGLQWSDIDFESGFLYVKRTLLQDSKKGGFYFGVPKSKTSKRKIPLTENAKAILYDQQKLQYKLKNQSIKWHNEWNGLVFTTINGNPVGASTFRITMIRIVKNINKDREADALGKTYNIFEHCYMHSLRHTFATRCIEKGVQPKTLQKILGHSSIQITMDLYVHVTDEHLEEELDKMNIAI